MTVDRTESLLLRDPRAAIFSTHAVRAVDRYECWAHQPAPSLASMFQTEPPDKPFDAHTAALALPSVVVAEARMTGLRYHRNAARRAADGVDHLGVCVVLRGGQDGDAGDRSTLCRPGEVLLGDFAGSHRWASQDSHVLTLAFARVEAEAVLGPVRALHGRVVDRAAAAVFVEPLRAMLPHLGAVTASRSIAMGWLHLLAAATGDARRPDEPGRAGIIDSRRALAFDLIGRNCADPGFDPAALARMLTISRASLYRMFEPEGGVAAAIRAARVETLRMQLANPANLARLSQLAYASGFTDQSGAIRAFRGAHGMSPGAYRSLVLGQRER